MNDDDDYVLCDIPEYPLDVPRDAPGSDFFRPTKRFNDSLEAMIDEWLERNKDKEFGL